MPYRALGRTGERVSAIGLGGSHLGLPHVDEGLSARIIHEAVDRGINFLDNSWDYNNGASEIRMGRALKNGYRQKTFVMTSHAADHLNASARGTHAACPDCA
jgi:aryl-alcohol dehydrogenase-like predicted oxidoreductase